jgi:hypothetical protein
MNSPGPAVGAICVSEEIGFRSYVALLGRQPFVLSC